MAARTCGCGGVGKGSYRLHQEALPGRADLERCTSSLGKVPVFDPPANRHPTRVSQGDLIHPIFLLVVIHLDLGEQNYS